MQTHKWWHGWSTQSRHSAVISKECRFSPLCRVVLLIMTPLTFLPRWLSMQMTHSLLRPIKDCRSPVLGSSNSTEFAAGWMPPRLGIFCEKRLFMLLPSINCLMHAVHNIKKKRIYYYHQAFHKNDIEMFNFSLPSLRELRCCSLRTMGSFPERKKAICPIFSRNCLTIWKTSICLSILLHTVSDCCILPFSSVSTDV